MPGRRGLLDQLRRLMRDNIQREAQIQSAETRIRMAFGEDYGLQVDSQPGRGTKASVTLPYVEQTEGSA